ncbi:MAG: hypothetical protein KatS3mg055_1636 [Chloroflexus sp.]|nr:MAG: hypothetical protein KatS3mg055_1636 [Chloroflexus sp.]
MTVEPTATSRPNLTVTVDLTATPTATVEPTVEPTATSTLPVQPTVTATLTRTSLVAVQVIEPLIEGHPPEITSCAVVVELREATDKEVTVTYVVEPGPLNPASPDSDYRVPDGITGNLVFPGGSPAGTTRTVVIEVIGDRIAEKDETIVFRLTGISGGELVADQSEQMLTIIDDDAM